MTYNIQHKNDGKNYVARDGSGNIKISYKLEPYLNQHPYFYLNSTDTENDYIEW
jgi:hypothetical protein